MALADRHYTSGPSFSSSLPPGVKALLAANIGVYLLNFLAESAGLGGLFLVLGLVPRSVVESFAVWQLGTYLFLHSTFDFTHILFNMLSLWMIGVQLENDWGTRRFLKYYFACGIGAGLCVVAANYAFGTPGTRTIGASGAIYGLLLAFGMLYPNAPVLFFFLFQIPAKYMVWILGGIAFLASTRGSGGGVSHVAHLGGMLAGFVLLRQWRGRRARRAGPGLIEGLRARYRRWKLERAKKKFQVYLKKRGSGGGPWVH